MPAPRGHAEMTRPHAHVDSHAPAHAGAHGGRSAQRRALGLTFGLTTAFMVAEVVGGLLTGSLALLADAGHMLSDSLSLAVALTASWLAGHPATPSRTFGLQRAEILAALFNGLTLVIVALWIGWEAIGRLSDPPDVLGGPMLAIAALGLLVNLVAVRILHAGGSESLNVSAAMRHVLADLLGSIGVLLAAGIILVTGEDLADPIVSLAIGILILGSAYPVLRDSLRILLEASPQGLDVSEVGNAMAGVGGVREVHDLHVWTITSGFPALAAHVTVGRDEDCHAKRREIERILGERFEIEHTTLQVDHEGPDLLQIDAAAGPASARTRSSPPATGDEPGGLG